MFDIGFWELCLIAVVALLILGPERLPTAARTAGLWIGKFQRMIGNVKSEIDRELQLDELRQRLEEEKSSITDMADNTIADVEKIQADMIEDIRIDTNGLNNGNDYSNDKSDEVNSETQSEDENSETPNSDLPNLEQSDNDSGHGEYEPPIDDKS